MTAGLSESYATSGAINVVSCTFGQAWRAIAVCTLCALTPGVQARDGGDLRLIDAVRNSDTAAVRAMIRQRADVNASGDLLRKLGATE